MHKTTGSPHSGFTLWEVMIVLLITAVLTRLGSQSLSQWQQRQQVKASATDLAYFLKRLQQQASWYHTTVSLSGTSSPIGVVAQSEGAITGVQRWQWRPLTVDIKVLNIVGEPRFFGKHGTAWPGSIELGNKAVRWRVIISAQGRIRYCQQGDSGCR